MFGRNGKSELEHRDSYRDHKEQEINAIAEVVKSAIAELAPDKGVVVINNLTIKINYASGGGATIMVKEE